MNVNNFAQKTNFSAGSEALQLTEMYLQSVNIPGMSFSHPRISGRSGTQLNLTGDTITFNDLSFELLVDENFQIYHEFTNKIFNTVNPLSGSFASIEFDFWVQVNDSKGYPLFKIVFNTCRVESIGDIDLNSTSEETEFLLPVQIKYNYFNIELANNSSSVNPTLRVQ